MAWARMARPTHKNLEKLLLHKITEITAYPMHLAKTFSRLNVVKNTVKQLFGDQNSILSF